MSRLSLSLALVLTACGCGSDDVDPQPVTTTSSTSSPDDPCPAPNRLVGERCIEPGVQDNGCPAGSLGLDDGSCLPAGVPPELCADGFVHDGDAGCDPILPEGPCPVGLMAVPGESECHPVMPCGEPPWGDIPVDATTVYVDADYSGGASDGSAGQPFTTIGEAVAVADDGHLIAVAAGTYAEDVHLQRPVRLWGICPDRVTLAGSGTGVPSLDIGVGADGTEVVGLAIGAISNVAVSVAGAEDVLLDRLWVHDCVTRGLNIYSDSGPTSVTVQSSLIERNHEMGVFVAGSGLTLVGVVVRDTLPRPGDQLAGLGIFLRPYPGTATPTTAEIVGSVVERNHDLGICIYGSEVTLDGLVVRDTLPQQTDQTFGRGIQIQPDPDSGASATAVVTSSLIERNHEIGIYASGAQATMEGLVVRDTLPRASDEQFGRGIELQLSSNDQVPTNASITSSLVESNHDTGVFAAGVEVSLEGLVVRDTLPQQAEQDFGRGINIQSASAAAQAAPTTATLSGCVVERNHEIGVLVAGVEASLEGLVVRDTLPEQNSQMYGRGINVQINPHSDTSASVQLTGSVVDRNRDFGVLVLESHATVAGLAIRETSERALDGLFGDGLAVFRELDGASATVIGVDIADSARAGLANFAGQVSLGGSILRCNAIDLVGQSHLALEFSFEDLGHNGCGCPEPEGTCEAVSAGLEPPAPPDDPEP